MMIGRTLGRYRIDSCLGAGGMGEVFRAWDGVLQRFVALKIVAKDEGGRAARLLTEARAAASLRHPNIVSVYDVGEADGFAFVSMDLIEGQTLRHYVTQPVSSGTKLGWLTEVASALAAAHRAGFVHRDVKPENVMIASDGTTRVLDFGLAKAFGLAASDSFHTGEGRVIGTPAYMAPEQLAGGPPAPAWDQYAWGVMAYELTTGQHPRLAGHIGVDGWVKPASHVPMLPHVSEVITRAMAPTADKRFPSMDAVAAALGKPAAAPAMQISAVPVTPARSAPTADTLETPIYPNAPIQQRSSAAKWWVLGSLILILIVAGPLVVYWQMNKRPTTVVQNVTVPPTAPTSGPTNIPTSSAPVPPISPTHSVGPARPHVAPPLPPAKLVVSVHGSPSLQYDQAAVDRVVNGYRGSAQMCVDQHPPTAIPAGISIDLELWSLDKAGEVRDARVQETGALATCLHDVFSGASFGPPKDPKMPAGAVFVVVRIER